MTYPIKTPKKLIEVALPLDDINEACQHEKNPFLKGHPRAMHLWWARRPLAAARAVIFAQMVNDPGGNRGYGPGMTKAQAQIERERLFEILRKLVAWENTNNEQVLSEARTEIWKSWRETCALNKTHPDALTLFDPEKLPAFHDPFAGGGALPLEAQRLGLESNASDLNPVAVLINKAMIEIPPKFMGLEPVGRLRPATNKKNATRDTFEEWNGTKGLVEDIRRYGYWIREEAIKRIGHLYPQVNLNTSKPVFLSESEKNSDLNTAPIIAWLWCRTVKSPNPAFSHVEVPLISNFILSSKSGNEAYIKPIIEHDTYHFEVCIGKPPITASNGTKASGRGANFECLLSKSPISGGYIKSEGQSGRMGSRLMAIVAEGKRGRVYLSPSTEHELIAKNASPDWQPDVEFLQQALGFRVGNYGMTKWSDLFISRQLVVLSTFSNLILEAKEKVKADALKAGMADDGKGLDENGVGATAYADTIAVYLGLAVSQYSRYCCSLCRWNITNQNIVQAFGRQAIQMIWDFAESNPLYGSLAIDIAVGWVASAINVHPFNSGYVTQADAQTQSVSLNKVISTDPPYYDNIGYADLSDFFYVWLRRSLRPIYPSLFATMAVPKAEELVATPYRHGGKENAEQFFLSGMIEAMHRLAEQSHAAFPVTIYYAFKQSETTDIGTGNIGWETFLQAVLKAGFVITGTWPVKTEKIDALKVSKNALASSILLVCRKRDQNAATISRREFLKELKQELSEAIEVMIGGSIGVSPVAPVDLAQAVIGPGMAIFSKYTSVLEADGNPMTVHDALVLINRTITEGGDDFDTDTQFSLNWFDEQGWSEGEFGKADVLARAKGTSVAGVAEAGVVESGAGKVRLLKWSQYPTDWSPENDLRIPVWEATHHLIRVLNNEGENAAGNLIAKMPNRSEGIRQLAYRLYTLCERKGWAEDARAYNELIAAWPAIQMASLEIGHKGEQMTTDQFAE